MIDPTWPHVALWRHPFGRVLRFIYIDFDTGIQEGAAPDWATTATLGRAEPFQAYNGVGAREIQIHFTFQNQNGDLLNEVVLPARFLDALKYGVYNPAQQLSYEAPPCLLKIGSLLLARVILTAGDVSWKNGVDPETLLPYQAEVQATFTVVRRFQSDLSYRFDGQWL